MLIKQRVKRGSQNESIDEINQNFEMRLIDSKISNELDKQLSIPKSEESGQMIDLKSRRFIYQASKKSTLFDDD